MSNLSPNSENLKVCYNFTRYFMDFRAKRYMETMMNFKSATKASVAELKYVLKDLLFPLLSLFFLSFPN